MASFDSVCGVECLTRRTNGDGGSKHQGWRNITWREYLISALNFTRTMCKRLSSLCTFNFFINCVPYLSYFAVTPLFKIEATEEKFCSNCVVCPSQVSAS